MIAATDVLAAKLVAQLGYLPAERLRQLLLAADQDESRADLATRLAVEPLLDDRQLRHARRYAALFDRVRHDAAMITNLERAGAITPGQLTEVLALLEAGDYRQQLRECLVYLGIVDEETAKRAAYETFVALRSKDEAVLRRYRAEGFQGVSRRLVPHDVIDGSVLRVSVLFRSRDTRRRVRKEIERVRMATAERPAVDPSASFLDLDLTVTEASPTATTGDPTSGADPEETRELDALQPPAPNELESLKEIGGYEIVECIGRGGMGAVFLAREPGVGSIVAVKTLLAGAADPAELARFEREAAICADLDHPNVVRLYDQGTTETGVRYMVIPFYTGRSLQAVLEAAGGRLSPAESFHLLEQALEGLEHVHQAGVVHRDMKAENLFVLSGQARQLKVIDLGIARRLDDDLPREQRSFQTATGKIMGSPAYIAPESISGDAIDGRTDIYSLGVMLFQLLTGRLPLTAASPYEYLREHLVGVPLTLEQARRDEYWSPELEQLVARMLGKERDDRPASCQEILDLLRGGLRDKAVREHASPPSAPEPKGFFTTFFKRFRSES